jgi:hypothetical protein
MQWCQNCQNLTMAINNDGDSLSLGAESVPEAVNLNGQ